MVTFIFSRQDQRQAILTSRKWRLRSHLFEIMSNLYGYKLQKITFNMGEILKLIWGKCQVNVGQNFQINIGQKCQIKGG